MPDGVSVDERPREFTVLYHGQPILFSRLTQEHGTRPLPGKIIGYAYRCPFERREGSPLCWLDTESGTRHALKFDELGRATIIGSVIHRSTNTTGVCNCGWHVVVTDGIAVDV